jgi:hypothetical protein
LIQPALSHVRCVPELHHKVEYIPSHARKASALKLMATYRVYVLLQHINRYRYQGHGKFVLTEEDIALLAEWLHLSPTRVGRLVKQMIKEDVFLYSNASNFPYISLVGRKSLTKRLAQLALEADVPDPGEVSYRKEVLEFEDFASLQKVSAQMLNGWLRVDKHGQRRLRWEDLEALWGKSRTILNKWLDKANIRKVHNYARIDGPGPCPDDTYTWSRRVRGRVYVCWQRANTYISEGLSKQANRGVCRNAAAELCEAHPEVCGEGIEYIRSNWPYAELPQDRRIKAFKRMRRGIRDHPDKTHYRHIGTIISRKTGRSYQTWLCEHVAQDEELQRELYLRLIA